MDKQDVEVNQKLLIYSSSGQKIQLEQLLAMENRNFDINFQDEKGNSALHSACYFDELEIVKLLVHDKEVNISLKTHRKESILHICASSNSFNCLQYLCELIKKKEIENLIDSINEWDETPLHIGVAGGSLECVKILCDNNASTTLKDKWSRSAVQVAFENGNKKIFDLLEIHSNPETIIKIKESPIEKIQLGNQENQKNIIEEFMKKKDERLNHVSSLNQIKVSHTFNIQGKVVDVAKSTQPNSIKKENLGKLFEFGVCPKNLNDLLKMTKDETIDVNGKDYYGWNALQKSLLWNKFEYVPLLLEVMSKEAINEIGAEGNNALHIQIQSSHDIDELKVFIDSQKVDLAVRSQEGMTAFDMVKGSGVDVKKEFLLLLNPNAE
jgi:ankyrin repeat protein